MKSIAFLLLGFFLAPGCSQKNNIPGDIMPKSKMETILWELMQTDEFVNYAFLKDSAKNVDKERIKLYQRVLEFNKISKDEFKKSYQFYMKHPEISKVMFDSLSTRADRQRNEVYKPKENKPK